MILLCSILAAPAPSEEQAGPPQGDAPWKEIDTGFWVGEFDAPQKAEMGDSRITVVKIDPQQYAFKLMCAAQHGRKRLTAKEWCQEHNLLAAVNAGMYQQDGFTSVGYMRNYDYINNSRLGRDNAIVAFNPVGPDLPPIQVIDRECQDFDSLKRRYNTLVQSIRMISCRQQNVWAQQAAKWSTVALGLDGTGKLLFLFTHSPYSVHDFTNILLSLPLDIQNAMYLEGGPQASLYLSVKDVTLERSGALENGLDNGSPLRFSWPIPNVIGVVRKSK